MDRIIEIGEDGKVHCPNCGSNILGHDCIDTLRSVHELLILEREAWKCLAQTAEGFLEREGYRKCDVRACNCGLYHKSKKGANAAEREKVRRLRQYEIDHHYYCDKGHGTGLPCTCGLDAALAETEEGK